MRVRVVCFFLIEDTTRAEYGISGRAYFRKLVIMLIRIGYYPSIMDGNDHNNDCLSTLLGQ